MMPPLMYGEVVSPSPPIDILCEVLLRTLPFCPAPAGRTIDWDTAADGKGESAEPGSEGCRAPATSWSLVGRTTLTGSSAGTTEGTWKCGWLSVRVGVVKREAAGGGLKPSLPAPAPHTSGCSSRPRCQSQNWRS